MPIRARDYPIQIRTIGQNDKNRLLQYRPHMHFEASVGACGTIGDNQAQKLDTKIICTHDYITFNDILIENNKVLPMLLIDNRQHGIELCRNTPNVSSHVSVESLD